MKKMYSTHPAPTVVADWTADKPLFFRFEEDFVEDSVRCIPMVVRFKLDACGIKLKLQEWSKMTLRERKTLADMDCSLPGDMQQYRDWLKSLVMKRTGAPATEMPVEIDPAWANTVLLPPVLVEKMKEFDRPISLEQWYALNKLQRFALIKLCRPGHENKNFPKAVKEFGLI